MTADTGGPGDRCMIERSASGGIHEGRRSRPGARGRTHARAGRDARAGPGGRGRHGRYGPRPHGHLVARAMATRSAAIPALIMVGAVSYPQATVGLPLHADFVAAHA